MKYKYILDESVFLNEVASNWYQGDEEANSLYKKLSKKYHPDNMGGDEELFKEMNSYQQSHDPEGLKRWAAEHGDYQGDFSNYTNSNEGGGFTPPPTDTGGVNQTVDDAVESNLPVIHSEEGTKMGDVQTSLAKGLVKQGLNAMKTSGMLKVQKPSAIARNIMSGAKNIARAAGAKNLRY